MAAADVWGPLGKHTSVSMTSKYNFNKIHISQTQGLHWASPSLFLDFLLVYFTFLIFPVLISINQLTFPSPEPNIGACNVFVIFQSVSVIQWCDITIQMKAFEQYYGVVCFHGH